MSTDPIANAHLRIARPTNQLDDVAEFYCSLFGFRELGRFADHDGFDGIMLGHPNAGYHLEFTRAAGHDAGKAPSKDNLLVFYLPDIEDWNAAVRHVESFGVEPVVSFNPYWDQQGRTYEDPDGYRVVLQNAGWQH